MRYLKLVAAIAFAFSVSANAQGDEVFYRNVCDTLASKGHAPVTLAASAIAEYNWDVSVNSGKWNYGTQKTTIHDSFSTLNLIVSEVKKFRFPYSVQADCREMDDAVFNYLTWNKAWTSLSLPGFGTYIYDSHALGVPGYDSTNAYNFLIMTDEPPIDGKTTFKAGEILVSKTFEFAFEWWFVGARYGLSYTSSVGHDSLSVLNTIVSTVKKEIPDTLSTVKMQVVKVIMKDAVKSEIVEPPSSSSSVIPSSSSQSSSSFEPPKSCSPTKSSDSKPSSSSFDPPKSCSPTKSSDSKPSSSSKDESSASTPSSDSDTTSDSKASSSSKGPKGSSSSDKTSIEMVRMELVDDEVVEMRTLDGSLVKNSRNVKPGIYYAKTSRGTWFKKVILPRGE